MVFTENAYPFAYVSSKWMFTWAYWKMMRLFKRLNNAKVKENRDFWDYFNVFMWVFIIAGFFVLLILSFVSASFF